MAEVSVHHWKRYGRERLYIKIGDETLGWVCLQTGQESPPSDAAQLNVFREQINAWRAGGEAPPPAADARMELPVHTLTGQDLTGRAAGAAAREEAERLGNSRMLQAQQATSALREAAAAVEAEYRRAHPVKGLLRQALGLGRTEQIVVPAAVPTQREANFAKGAAGEVATGQVLTSLGQRYRVLHAVPIGAGNTDIDHVLIGPAGVFTLNSKNHAGTAVWIAGNAYKTGMKWTRNVEKAQAEARRASEKLCKATGITVKAQGVIAITAAAKLVIREQPHGVTVVALDALLAWLWSQPEQLTASQINRLYAAARDTSIWADA